MGNGQGVMGKGQGARAFWRQLAGGISTVSHFPSHFPFLKSCLPFADTWNGMPRTLEIVRQWELILALDKSAHGLTLRRLAEIGTCSTRTIRRDLAALQRAGFPLYDDKVDGSARWKLAANPLKGLDPGFRLTELCALYFSRAMLEAFVGSPFHADVRSAFARFEKALPPTMRSFLDALPGAIKAKPAKMKLAPRADARGERTTRLMDAILNRRQIDMRYASVSSRRTKDYVIHPYRIAYAEGGLYLIAFVPEYGETRTFALERISHVSQRDATFAAPEPLPTDVFPHSLGVHTGTPESITIEFNPWAAGYVRERQWHPSQRQRSHPDGSLVMDLRVCRDEALRSWILGFGPSARVVSPQGLADEIARAHRSAWNRYQPLEAAAAPAHDGPVQRRLPFPADIRRVS